MNIDAYQPQDLYDEYFAAAGVPRPDLAPLVQWFKELPAQDLPQVKAQMEALLYDLGATFSLDDEERVLPFDPLPRVITAQEWQHLKAGLQQRVKALNAFCADIYGDQEILQAGIIPREVIESAERFLPASQGLKPPGGVWCHVSGIDLVRDRQGDWCVLEDNLRVPSGIAYVLKNRQAMEQVLPELMATFQPHRVDGYAQHLKTALKNIAPASDDSRVVVLTPGQQSSAHFEHALLAQQMGVALIEPQDLTIHQGSLHHQTPDGPQPIEVIYRRGDTEFLAGLDLGDDYPDSLVAIIELCQQGQLAFANTLGTGIGDDKVIYAYVPEIIQFYLGEAALLSNVPTYLCWRDDDRRYVLEHLDELVVKAASAEGGDGMLVGVNATSQERADFAEKIRQNPRHYMAQPTVALSQIPTVIDGEIVGRHTDLRPYVIHQGDDIYVHPGGLTRVALAEGELVVNSSQGGGAKDTWILS
ncbi:MAG: circularly permuted type 2 ATP-grasp protein [Cyanobacteria bacterium P01_H01_bin.162]